MGPQTTERYDTSLSRERRKTTGVFYTPEYVARHMVEHTLGKKLDVCRSVEEALKIKVCDPACGSGVFLRMAQEKIARWAIERGFCGSERVKLEAAIQRECLYGSDIDSAALRLAAKALPLANWLRIDALRPGSFAGERFDVVVGNPPYGATTALSGDSARHFMERATAMLKPDGHHAFVVPKAFLYSSSWRALLEKFLPQLSEIVDCGKIWPEVRLEQVIYFYEAGAKARSYRSGVRVGERFVRLGSIAKSSVVEFGFALNGVTALELRIGKKIRAVGSSFGEQVVNRRGLALQSLLSEREAGGVAVFGGKQIARFELSERPKGYLSAAYSRLRTNGGATRGGIDSGSAPVDCILAQNIVAHVQSPVAHLKIAAALPDPARGPVLVLDTVNRLFNRSTYSSHYLLAVLNSRLVAWYVYRFIVGKAVRTIHFDTPVTSRIPLPIQPKPALVRKLERAALKMSESPSAAFDAQIDTLVYELYGLSPFEVSCFERG